MSYKKRVIIFITIIVITFLALAVFFFMNLGDIFKNFGGGDVIPEEVEEDFRERVQ